MTEVEPLGWAACSFEIEMFNEKSGTDGVARRPRGVSPDGKPPAVGRSGKSAFDRSIGVLNLPSQRWVRATLHAFFEGKETAGISRVSRERISSDTSPTARSSGAKS
jgi:hypothetical protein